MDYLKLFFNAFFLLFWVRFWSASKSEFHFNPFLSGTVRLTDSVLSFLRPVLALPEQAAAFVVMLFITLFKTVLFHRLGVVWGIRLGTYFQFVPDDALSGAVAATLLFSFLHAIVFILRLWSVYLLVKWITPPFRVTRGIEAIGFFARPFSWLPTLAQPFALFALHGLFAFALTRLGSLNLIPQPMDAAQPVPTSPFLSGPLFFQLLKTGWLGALSFADGLMFMTRGLFALIIGNLLASILQARGLMLICSEGVELLLGRFAKRGIGGMGFDFTPLIFFFVVDLLYNSICQGLYKLIQSPFFN